MIRAGARERVLGHAVESLIRGRWFVLIQARRVCKAIAQDDQPVMRMHNVAKVFTSSTLCVR